MGRSSQYSDAAVTKQACNLQGDEAMHMPGDSAGPEGSSMGDMSLPTGAVGEVVRIAPAAWPTTAVPGVGCGHSDIWRCGGRRQDIRIAVGGPAQCGCAWLWRGDIPAQCKPDTGTGWIVGYVARHILRAGADEVDAHAALAVSLGCADIVCMSGG